ncbi:hypothetical protein SXCC_00515 [Gluconacetobacter sp. SXCC-1]|nr:hypothetical protein SXCC_00515 [Gluconacetobacter sp. SXCC-1]
MRSMMRFTCKKPVAWFHETQDQTQGYIFWGTCRFYSPGTDTLPT